MKWIHSITYHGLLYSFILSKTIYFFMNEGKFISSKYQQHISQLKKTNEIASPYETYKTQQTLRSVEKMKN